jgi:hypothetical protein
VSGALMGDFVLEQSILSLHLDPLARLASSRRPPKRATRLFFTFQDVVKFLHQLEEFVVVSGF